MYYHGLKIVPLGFKWLLILKYSKCNQFSEYFRFTITRSAKQKHEDKFKFTLLNDCRIYNFLNPRGTNLSPRQYNHFCLELLTSFYHSFSEHRINVTLEVNIQQYIMNVLGTVICVCIALNTGYYKHMVSSMQ